MFEKLHVHIKTDYVFTDVSKLVATYVTLMHARCYTTYENSDGFIGFTGFADVLFL